MANRPCPVGKDDRLSAANEHPPADLSRRLGVLFDLYDTLIYVDEAGPRRERERMLEELGAPADHFSRIWQAGRDRRMAGHGGTLAQQMAEALALVGVAAPSARLEELAERDIAALLQASGVYEGVPATLQELRQRGYRLALLSNCSYTGDLVLDHLGLRDYFDAVVMSHQVRVLKPDPAIFREDCARLGLAPADCIFVADGAFNELDAAHRLGLATVRITQPRQSSDYGSSEHADYDIGDVAELLEMLPGSGRKTGIGRQASITGERPPDGRRRGRQSSQAKAR